MAFQLQLVVFIWLETRCRNLAPVGYCLVDCAVTKVDLTYLRAVREEEHDRLIRSLGLHGGFFTSAKSGENVLRSFYKAVGDTCGVPLSNAELSAYDKVLQQHTFLPTSKKRSSFPGDHSQCG